MKLFSKSKKTYHKRTSIDPAVKQERAEKKVVWDKFIEQMKKDPELERQFILKKMGIEAKPPDPTDKKRQEIRSKLVDEAFDMIGEDDDLRRQYAENVITEVIGEGKPRKRRGEPEYYGEPGSSISQALEEVQSLSELREKLQDLGMVEGGGKGFFKGMGMKDVLEALPYISALMGKGELPQETGKPSRTYVVPVNGQYQELSENEYRKLVKDGKLQLEQPREPAQSEPTLTSPVQVGPDQAQPIQSKEKEVPELPEFLQGTDFTIVEGWLEQEPEYFVINLKAEVDSGVEESRLAWGFLTTADYKGLVEKITPYRQHPDVGALVQRVLSDEGKLWLERVLELVKETTEK